MSQFVVQYTPVSLKEEFYLYCSRNDITNVTHMLDNHPALDINAGMSYAQYSNGLHVAANNNFTDILKLLLADKRIDARRKCQIGRTALFMACDNGSDEAVKILIKDGRIDINEPNNYGVTPLYIATAREHTKIVLYLIASGKELNFGEPGNNDNDCVLLASARYDKTIYSNLWNTRDSELRADHVKWVCEFVKHEDEVEEMEKMMKSL
jgi:ankyrin repeat protein